MFSSLPPTAHDHQPLPVIFENLERLSVRTKREVEQYLKDYAATQARNRRVYAVQGENERKAWGTEESQTYQPRGGVEDCRVHGMESPFLKARVHLRNAEREQETSRGDVGAGESIRIKEKVIGHSEDGEEGRKHTALVTGREKRTRYKRGENEDVRERIERSKSQYYILSGHTRSFNSAPSRQGLPNAGNAGERRRRLSVPLLRRGS